MKRQNGYRVEVCMGVAPRTGAWIETARDLPTPLCNPQSPPARGRGLKPLAGLAYSTSGKSRPPHGGVD